MYHSHSPGTGLGFIFLFLYFPNYVCAPSVIFLVISWDCKRLCPSLAYIMMHLSFPPLRPLYHSFFYGTNWIERTWLPVESNCELDGMSGDCPWRIGSSAPHIRANVIKAKKAGYLFVWSKLKLNPALHYNYIRLFQLENNLISFLGVGDFGCGVYWFKKKKKKHQLSHSVLSCRLLLNPTKL